MEKIRVRAIIEILGRPPEHITEGLKMIVVRIKNEKGIKIIEEVHHQPVSVKDSPNLFTTFMELTLELDNLNVLFGFIFQYMPSNIEITEPENLKLTNQELNQAANHLTQRMHQYDAVAKKVIGERDMAVKKLYEVAPHLFKTREQIQKEQQVQQQSSKREKKSNNKDKHETKKKKK